MNREKLERGKQLGISKRIQKEEKFVWYSYAIQKMDNIYYVIEELKCICTVCGFEFFEYMPLNYELVCFIDELGEKYFLPTYGEYGYLDLLEKIVKNWTPDKEITSRVVKSFEERLEKITPIKVSLVQKVKWCMSDEIGF